MYSPTLVSSEKRDDGMTYLVVNFVSDSGQPTVVRKTNTDTFTVEWFKLWCKRQVEMLNVPQDAPPSPGTINLTGVTTEPDATRTAQIAFDAKLGKLERMIRIAATGVIATDHPEIVKFRSELAASVVAKPGLIKG